MVGNDTGRQELQCEEIMIRLNPIHSCKFPIQNTLSPFLRLGMEVFKYKELRLPAVLHGYGTCDVMLGEEHRLMVIYGAEGKEVTGDWRKLHSEEHHDLCCAPNVIWVSNQEL
jgi:hypothetical protein